MAKITETTPKVERSFTLEVNEDELQVLKALLSRTTINSPHCGYMWNSIDSITAGASTYEIRLTGTNDSCAALYKVIKIQ